MADSTICNAGCSSVSGCEGRGACGHDNTLPNRLRENSVLMEIALSTLDEKASVVAEPAARARIDICNEAAAHIESLERTIDKAFRILSDGRLHEVTRVIDARDVLVMGDGTGRAPCPTGQLRDEPNPSSRENAGVREAWNYDLSAAPMPNDDQPMRPVLLAWHGRDGSAHCGEGYWHAGETAWWWANTSPGDYYSDAIEQCIDGAIYAWKPLPAPPPLSASPVRGEG